METDLNYSTTTALNSASLNYQTPSADIDQASPTGESYWDNDNFNKYLGYYKTHPELKVRVDSMIMWTVGRGYEANTPKTQAILDNIRGWGDEDFITVMENHDRMTMVNGDAFTEIIRNDKGTLINLKPLNPGTIRTVVDNKGLIIRYEQLKNSKVVKKFEPKDILHSTEMRAASEIHGTSRIESVMWLLDTKREIMNDLRRVMHRSTIRVLYVDADDTARFNTLRTQYKEGIKNGEVLILPGKRGVDAEFEDLSVPPVQAYMEFARYIDIQISRAVGVPDVILGGSEQYTEASSKVGYLTFEQPYMYRQRKLEADLWNQCAIKVKFNRPVSLKDDVQGDESKNTGQVNIQPNETQVGVGRSE